MRRNEVSVLFACVYLSIFKILLNILLFSLLISTKRGNRFLIFTIEKICMTFISISNYLLSLAYLWHMARSIRHRVRIEPISYDLITIALREPSNL